MTPHSLYPAPAIDRKTLTRLLDDFGGDTESLAELLGEYREDAPRLLGQMQTAIAAADVAALSMAAHTLKSTSASVGATALAALCGELSRATRGESATPGSALVAQIAGELDRVRAVLTGPAGAPDQAVDVAALLGPID